MTTITRADVVRRLAEKDADQAGEARLLGIPFALASFGFLLAWRKSDAGRSVEVRGA